MKKCIILLIFIIALINIFYLNNAFETFKESKNNNNQNLLSQSTPSNYQLTSNVNKIIFLFVKIIKYLDKQL